MLYHDVCHFGVQDVVVVVYRISGGAATLAVIDLKHLWAIRKPDEPCICIGGAISTPQPGA